MTPKFSISIFDPENSALVPVAEWAKREDPTKAQRAAIAREDGSVLLVAKDDILDDNWEPVRAPYDCAVELARNFNLELLCRSDKRCERFRLPTRRECLDIYDARFQGLDEAIKLIGGSDLERWAWSEEDTDPRYPTSSAFAFSWRLCHLVLEDKTYPNRVRPVLEIK